MATNRGLAGWRRRETAKAAAERRAQREAVRITPAAKDQLSFWRGQVIPTPGFVYFLHDAEMNAVKIGYADDPLKRAISLQIGNPRTLQLAHVLYGTPASEEGYHELWGHHHLRGEWFQPADEILEWTAWAARVQREQLSRGLDDFRVRSTHGKHPKEMHTDRGGPKC